MKYFTGIGHVYIVKMVLSMKQMELNTVMYVRCCEYCTAHHVTLHIFFPSVCSTSQVREDPLV